MMYLAHEITRAALTPWRMVARLTQQSLDPDVNPFADWAWPKQISAAAQVFQDATKRFGKPAFGLTETVVDMQRVPVRERIIGRKPFCQLKHFSRAPDRWSPRVLLVAPLSGHYATLLRDTVESLLPYADVYITDWRDARNVPVFEGGFDLDTYVDYIIDYLTLLGPNTHVLAVCQPGVPVLAAVARMAEINHPATPSSMTLMGSPIDTRRSPTVPNLLAESNTLEQFERRVISHVPVPYAGVGRRVYPGFMQLSGFMSMNADRHMGAHYDYFRHLIEGDGDSADKHRAFYDEYLAVMDLTAEFYLQTIERVFQKHELAEGTFRHHGHLIKPSTITNTALMTVEGGKDDITGLGQTEAAHDLCSGLPEDMKVHYTEPGVGHYGIFNGSRWESDIAPRVMDFIYSHDRNIHGKRVVSAA